MSEQSGYTPGVATDRFTVHIQIELRDQHGFSTTPSTLSYVLDHDADDMAQQQQAIQQAALRASAEWAAQGNPLSLF